MFKALLLFVSLLPLPVMATEGHDSTSTALRVGGNYKVESIKSASKGSFNVTFRAENQTGRFDVLRIRTDHLHVSVKEGETLKISASILKEKTNEAEIHQIVLFIPRPEGETPVWLLSSTQDAKHLEATQYLKMHAPQTDFLLF
jgi:hypothetical protein